LKPPGLAYRDQIVIATFSVVAFSVIVQGIAMPLFLKRWNLLP
jgi:NhaP-type Na+/H+ or K+/H+ antiporter